MAGSNLIMAMLVSYTVGNKVCICGVSYYNQLEWKLSSFTLHLSNDVRGTAPTALRFGINVQYQRTGSKETKENQTIPNHCAIKEANLINYKFIYQTHNLNKHHVLGDVAANHAHIYDIYICVHQRDMKTSTW